MGISAARNSKVEREDWLFLIDKLLSQIEEWAGQREWQIRRDEKTVNEAVIGTYSVPVLQIKLPAGVLYS